MIQDYCLFCRGWCLTIHPEHSLCSAQSQHFTWLSVLFFSWVLASNIHIPYELCDQPNVLCCRFAEWQVFQSFQTACQQMLFPSPNLAATSWQPLSCDFSNTSIKIHQKEAFNNTRWADTWFFCAFSCISEWGRCSGNLSLGECHSAPDRWIFWVPRVPAPSPKQCRSETKGMSYIQCIHSICKDILCNNCCVPFCVPCGLKVHVLLIQCNVRIAYAVYVDLGNSCHPVGFLMWWHVTCSNGKITLIGFNNKFILFIYAVPRQVCLYKRQNLYFCIVSDHVYTGIE